MKQMRAIVEGRVQGVGFREYVRKHAERLHVTGCVRNLDNGALEVVAEGDETALAHLHMLLEKGPSMARVDDVQVSFHPPGGGYSGFCICS